MTKNISQAFIFAAGRGERMRPITDTIPKPLVKIKNKSIIDYTIEKLNKISDIKKIIINGFYLKDQIEAHIKNLNNSKIIFSKEIDKIETGGGLIFASNEINFNEPLLTINGDVLWKDSLGISDIKNLVNTWKECDCDILLGLKKKEEFLGYDGNIHGGGDFNFDQKTGNLKRFSNQEMSHVFVGLQIINPKILQQNFVKNLGKCFSMSEFYKATTQENGDVTRIKGVELSGKYFHIGTVDAIKMTEENL
jgi:MurNAc alpha-1-phosphate uridylyltransferase